MVLHKKQPTGFLIIDKPPMLTSHDVVDVIRALTKESRVGHAGTLDPFATGVLIVGVGRKATKRLGIFLKQNKSYVAKLRLGAVSDTHDKTGKIRGVAADTQASKGGIVVKIEKQKELLLNDKLIAKYLTKFVGMQKQVPPSFSAIKRGGKKAYEIAREGGTPKLEARKVTIYRLRLLSFSWPYIEITIKVSSGTYIRALARDIGKKLETGSYVEELRRTSIGSIGIKQSVPLRELTEKNWQHYLIPVEKYVIL